MVASTRRGALLPTLWNMFQWLYRRFLASSSAPDTAVAIGARVGIGRPNPGWKDRRPSSPWKDVCLRFRPVRWPHLPAAALPGMYRPGDVVSRAGRDTRVRPGRGLRPALPWP